MRGLATVAAATVLVLLSGGLLPRAAAIAAEGGGLAEGLLVVIDLRTSDLPTRIAVLTCAGLFNRDEAVAGAAYTILGASDLEWLADVDGITDPPLVPADAFLARCLKPATGVARGIIHYNATTQQITIPNLITMAAVLDAVPLEPGSLGSTLVPVVFDALAVWDGFSAYNATEWVYERYVNKTTGLAKMNPGLDVHGSNPSNPPLTKQPNPGLVDYIVKERLFNFFLNDGCLPFTAEGALEDRIVSHNPWPEPIAAMGYDDTWSLGGGDIFEAETNCVPNHNMGQIASDGCNNLAYFSRHGPITSPLRQNPEPEQEDQYDPTVTYIGLVIGDGDNINFMKGSRKAWFKERLANCAKDPQHGCFPLLWSASPALLRLAPGWLRWYYNQSYATKADYFVLPPSGELYAYPGQMLPADQAAFVAHTENSTYLMNASATVAWEYESTWGRAISDYFPRYSERGLVRGFFALDVPFDIPVFSFSADEHFKVLGERENLVLFRPRTWRGTDGHGPKWVGNLSQPFSKSAYFNASMMSQEVNGFPPGTVSYIYMTSDGGAKLQDYYDLVPKLAPHVKVVSSNTLIAMAVQKHRAGRNASESVTSTVDEGKLLSEEINY
eukprot:COSAG05_NODE_3307_length_2162_cov_1.789142_1_plen_612_part_00